MQTEHERKEAGTITVPITVSNYDLDCILCTCFEGGSNYWIDKVLAVDNDFKGAEYASEVISHGGTLKAFVDGEEHLLTKPMLLKGCELYVKGQNDMKGRAWCPDDFDVEDTDIILQYALFGKVVFG